MKDEEMVYKAKKPQDLKPRTTDFALGIIRLYVSLPKTTEAQILASRVCVQAHQSVRNIVRDIAQNRMQT